MLLSPSLASAACVENGSTVVYINGIFTSVDSARQDLENLQGQYFKLTKTKEVTFINGYNPSHLAGAGDITHAAAQTLNSSVSGHDLTTILLQVHPQITTRKLVLVGHSQGAFYANEMYQYLLAHGSPRAAVGVYHVGTPASAVAGGGTYITSSNDTIINAARAIASSATDGLIPLAAVGTAPKAKPPLPANVALSGADYGHGFSSVYLAEAPERVVGDIHNTIKNLKAEYPSEAGECFAAPNAGLGYKATKAGFAVADTAAAGMKAGAVAAGQGLAAVAQGAYGVATKLVKDIGVAAGGLAEISQAADGEHTPTNFDIFSKLYGSSLSKDEYKELLGSAAAVAPMFVAESAPQAAPQVPDVDPEVQPPKKITYLSGSRSRNNKEQEEVMAPAEVVELVVPPEEEVPPAEPEPEPTPEPEPEPEPAPPAPAFVEVFSDTFDAYNDKGWQTPGNIFSGSLIPFSVEADSSLCHLGSCVVGMGGIGGFGGGSSRPYILKEVGAASAGYLVVWAKRQDVWREVVANTVLCITGTSCTRQYWGNLPAPNDNAWHQYLFAWRQGTEAVQTCMQRDSVDIDACSWADLAGTSAEDTFDAIGLTGMTLRSDLGDRIWFDDISISLLQ